MEVSFGKEIDEKFGIDKERHANHMRWLCSIGKGNEPITKRSIHLYKTTIHWFSEYGIVISLDNIRPTLQSITLFEEEDLLHSLLYQVYYLPLFHFSPWSKWMPYLNTRLMRTLFWEYRIHDFIYKQSPSWLCNVSRNKEWTETVDIMDLLSYNRDYSEVEIPVSLDMSKTTLNNISKIVCGG